MRYNAKEVYDGRIATSQKAATAAWESPNDIRSELVNIADAVNARAERYHWAPEYRKAVIQDISRISPFYAEVYRYIASKDFLDFISTITGIPSLIHDEQMFGGGNRGLSHLGLSRWS